MNNTINYSGNSLAFKTKIIFLSPKGLSEIFTKYENKNLVNICDFFITDNERVWNSGYRLNVKRGYTSGIKTCTAGICADKGKAASLFWHVENSLKNIENFPILANLIKGTNAIIIGSKKNYKYSTELFDTFVKHLKSKNIPATIIKGTKDSEAGMLFDAMKDTLYVSMQDIYRRDKYVNSNKELKKACDVVEILPTDSVDFYDFLPPEIVK